MRSCSSAASTTSFGLFTANDRGKGPSFIIIHGVQSSNAPPPGIARGFLRIQVANSVHPIDSSSSSSNLQVELEFEDESQIQPPDQDEFRMVRVKVQLQKECQFGQQFLVSGDHPRLGSWKPSDAVPMIWSQGHVWTAELDLCVGELIQFKFILRENSGKMLWQPGPNRVFQTWETNSRIISVFGDWENAALFQQVMESDEFMVHDTNPSLNGHDSVSRNQVVAEIFNELCTSNKGPRRENNILQIKGDSPCLTKPTEDLTPKEEKVKFKLHTKNGQAELDQKQEEEGEKEEECQEKKDVSAELMFNKEHAQINHQSKRGFTNGDQGHNKFKWGQETLRRVMSKLGIL